MSVATLDGFSLTTDVVGWSLTHGTSPHVRTIDLPADVADAIAVQATPHGSTLVLHPDGFDPIEVKKLTVLGVGPSDRPDMRVLKLADRRWVWNRQHVYRHLNVRTKTGDRKRVDDPAGPLAVAQYVDVEDYRRWSLDGDRTWSVQNAILSVLKELVGGDWRDEGSSKVPAVTIENMLVDDSGDAALGRLLSHLGGALDLWVDYDGTVVLAGRYDDGERALVGAPTLLDPRVSRTRGGAGEGIGPAIAGPPLWIVQDRRLERPAYYEILYDRHVELRFDAIEDEDAGSQTRDDPPLRSRCVAFVPEPTLTVAGRVVLAGTAVPIEDYLVAKRGRWGVPGLPDLDLATVRALWLSSGCHEYAPPLLDEGGTNARAIHAVQHAYRQVYQIEREWRERLAWWRPVLTSVVDPTRGAMAASPVYADHALWLSWRATEQEKPGSKPDAYAIVRNVPARTDKTLGGIASQALTAMRRAPAVVAPVDVELGIYRLAFLMDATGQQVHVIPSALDANHLPTTDPSKRNLWLQWGKLTEAHEVSVVLTCGLTSPNDVRVLHKVKVEPRDVAARYLGRADPGPCLGPPVQLRVHETVTPARFAWLDAHAAAIRRAFSATGSEAETLLAPCLVNGDELKAIAEATAARHLGALLDRVEGSHTAPLTPAKPAGTAQIDHLLTAGHAQTTVGLPVDPPPLDMTALLPDAVRKRVLRQLPGA